VNDGHEWHSTTGWEADEALVRSVREERWLDPSLEDWCRTIEPADIEPLPVLYPELLAEMRAQFAREPYETTDGSRASAEFALAGPEGSGRQSLAAQLSGSFGRALLAVDIPGLFGRPRGPSASPLHDLIRVVRLARARSALLYWRNPEVIAPADWARLRTIAGFSLSGVRSIPFSATWGAAIPPLSTAKRFELWEHVTRAPVPSIVRTQRLTPAEICLAARAPDEASIHSVLARAVPRSSDLLNILPCPYSWDDLVVSPELSRTLHDFEAQIRLRWEVYEEWGFNRLTHLGQGISALFGGPSGTGKTMSAQVLARALDLTLYRVDLSGVVNKYIGETEKRLREVFDACERSGGLLFFDEADALFGARMQVNDSHDRFANIEIDYLLQRIEQFDGIAILATNRKNDIDTAFLRRLRFVCDFLPPNKPERLTLWHKALPAHSPSGEVILGDIDFDGLAEHLDLNGAQIKAIALGAAFLARNESTTINMDHIELATARELAKRGQRLRRPFAQAAVL
jgi:AAA+ superfamily predicted ATPase